MKKTLYLILTVFLVACNGDNVPDCFQNAGDIVQQEIEVATFDKIIVFERVELIVTQAATQKVVVETGEYLMNDVKVTVTNGQLVLKNQNGCNLTRDYGLTKVFVETPDLVEIRNSSGLTVRSNGALHFPGLSLVSENSNDANATHTDGDFRLEFHGETLNVATNNLTNVFVSGTVNNLFVGFYSGNGRFEGGDLVAQNVEIFQRSSNDMILNPQQSITGEIRSTGDVILVNEPPIVDVQQFYTGELIIQ
ncbi:MAG TPA: head GIN domain-containing protein [Aquaticitalea sp.]|nr:head GIN domain-containing protein [Aquaticitalea sp.]